MAAVLRLPQIMTHDATRGMAVNATLHCITGCSIGEIAGMVISSIANLANLPSIALSIGLSFVCGYSLSALPLMKSLGTAAAYKTVLAADTVSIATMELADNTVVALVPGALNASLVNPLFWLTMPLSLCIAFWAAVPVNQYLIRRGKGHALVHQHHTEG